MLIGIQYSFTCRNNLIFYGVSPEERETLERLESKVKEVIKGHFKIVREVVLAKVYRLHTGPKVLGCRPVLVRFENFKDKEDVLQASRCQRKSVISVTEDFSKKTRESRQELRKIMRQVKKNNPERSCFLQYDKLFIDGKIFMYSEVSGEVEELAVTNPTEDKISAW